MLLDTSAGGAVEPLIAILPSSLVSPCVDNIWVIQQQFHNVPKPKSPVLYICAVDLFIQTIVAYFLRHIKEGTTKQILADCVSCKIIPVSYPHIRLEHHWPVCCFLSSSLFHFVEHLFTLLICAWIIVIRVTNFLNVYCPINQLWYISNRFMSEVFWWPILVD